MASGKVHLSSNIITGIGLVLLSELYYPEITIPVIIGSTIGILITPDMDLEGTTITEKILRKIPIIGFIWQISFYGYALLFRHRGYSHNIILGTIGRIIWLIIILFMCLIIIIGFMYIFGVEIPLIIIPDINYNYLIIIIAVWYIQDWNHYLLDFLFSDRRRKRHGRKNRKMLFM